MTGLAFRIFKVFTLPYLKSLIVLPSAFYILTMATSKTPLEAASQIATVYLVADAVILSCVYIITRGAIAFPFPWRNSAKYLFASAAMGSILFLIPHPQRITSTFLVTIVARTVYLGILYFAASETKFLIKSTLQELKNRFV